MSLTLAEARVRAALLHDVSYVLDLDITDADSFAVRAEVTFSCREPGAETFLELAHALELRVDGAEPEYDGNRIRLTDLQATQTILVEARLPYVTDGDGMHTFTDPADGETYRSAYCSIDIAHLVYPCFDQNDLKASITLRVTAPEAWTVLANSRVVSSENGRWEFATTPPLPPAMFAMCGGPWASVTWEHAGLPFGWHARASLREQLERDADDLRRVTEACFDHYAEVFTEPFPFDSYDQAMVPGHNWGAMETPGCVTYRDEMLPLSPLTQPERRARSMVIAHEMAHMWFGDLVTMTWWEDTWLQESFADYLGFRVAQEAGVEAPWVDFTIARKPYAYLADARRSTHPVAPRAEDVPDVDAASGNFDALSYAKGNSCLRQLVTWIGEDAFYTGVNAYLSRHKWGNTVLDDFVDALDEATPDRDVRAWAQAWLRTTGFDTITATRDGDGPGSEVVLTREGSRPHTLRVTSYDDSWVELGSVFVDLADEPVRVPGAAAVVPNAHGETYARVRLDDVSWAAVSQGLAEIPDPDARALLWATAVDLAWAGELPMDDFLALVERHLPAETHPAVAHNVPTWAGGKLLTTLVPAEAVTGVRARLSTTYATALEQDPHPDVAAVLTRHLAAVDSDQPRLRGFAATDDASLRWTALKRLSSLGALDADDVERERAADGTIVAELGAARALAARPDPQAKADAWTRIVENPKISNREVQAIAQGLWDPERTDLVATYVDRYLAETPRLAVARGSAFAELMGKHVFPTVPLTEGQVAALRTALVGDLPTILRRAWEDALDDVAR